MIDSLSSTRFMTWIRRAGSLAILGVIGCNSDPDGAIKLVPVSGVITINGKPMANAAVSFIPDVSNTSSTAGGDTTGPDGNYMAQYRGRTGLAPGKYKVTVTPGVASADSSANVSEAFKNDPFMAGEAARSAAASKPVAKAKEIKGEFEAEVSNSASTLDFDVKSTESAAASHAAAH